MFDEEMESEGYRCPYCKEVHFCDDWGYDYDGEVIKCGDCGKKFYATADHSVTFNSTPDCELNDEEHDLEFYSKTNSGKDSFFCNVCNKCVIKDNK